MENIKGLDNVMKNLNAEIQAIEGRTGQGLIEAGILIRRDMDITPPLIPIDTGNLRQSWFTTLFKKMNQIGLIMGFSSNYAVFVHEFIGAKFKRPNSGAKFFESSIKRNEKRILATIAKHAKIK